MMGSSSGLSSNSSGGVEGDNNLVDQRKRKRMISNRESARRSRARKQKHLDGLTAQVARLKSDNHQILKRLNDISQHYASVEANNAILRAQVAELSHRLQALNEIVSFANNAGSFDLAAGAEPVYDELDEWAAGFVNSSWNCFSQPALTTVAASADAAWFQN